MKKIDLSQFIQIIANVGVIAGIIFLGVEINQNSEMMTAQTRNAVAQSVIENIKMGMDPRLVDAYLKSVRHDALSEEEVFLLDQLANATFRMWENTYYQYRMGLFDADEIEADMEVWQQLMREPAYMDHWQDRRMSYSKQFRVVIDSLVERQESTHGSQ